MVKDTGVGITEDGQRNLFKMFGKLRESQQINQTGCGLGLTICEKLVNKLGGELRLDSTRNVGTSVYFTVNYE